MLQDFIATAPTPAPPALMQLGGDAPRAASPVVLLCVGNGLSVTGLLPAEHGHVPFEGQGGRVTLPACNAEEAELIGWCMRRFGHPSAECFLSWRGIRLLHEALADVRGGFVRSLSSDEVVLAARTGRDGLCADTIDTFCAMLGTVASNLAVTLGAFGGVYVRGEVVARIGPLFARSPFRERFDAKGRFAGYVGQMPVFVIS